MENNRITVIIDPSERDRLRKQLFLCAAGSRDIKLAIDSFDDIKGVNLEEISDIHVMGKTYMFIISYARIFSKNNITGKIESANFINSLKDEEKRMHNAIIQMRNEIYAHNDPQHISVLIYHDADKLKPSATTSLGYHYLSSKGTIISPLLRKTKDFLERELDKLLSTLYSTDNAYQVNASKSISISYYSGFLEKNIYREDKNDEELK